MHSVRRRCFPLACRMPYVIVYVLCSRRYCDAFPNVKAGWLDALGMDHEEQGDFLQKFSVGAALVHTESARDGSEATSAKDSSQARRGVGGTELYDV